MKRNKVNRHKSRVSQTATDGRTDRRTDRPSYRDAFLTDASKNVSKSDGFDGFDASPLDGAFSVSINSSFPPTPSPLVWAVEGRV